LPAGASTRSIQKPAKYSAPTIRRPQLAASFLLSSFKFKRSESCNL
jgi:hypothetical protein